MATSLLFTAVFVADWVTGFGLPYHFALVPQDLVQTLKSLPTDPNSLDAWLTLGTVFTTVLVHADLMHLAFNVGYFWLFGTLLAQVAGDRWVVMGLMWSSIASAAAFVIHRAGGPPTQVIGASGAISGIAGLYVLLAFRWEIPWAEAWPLARPVPPLHAALVAIAAAAMDVYALRTGGGNIAQDAHLGGFTGGLLLGAVLTTLYPTWERFQRAKAGGGVRGP